MFWICAGDSVDNIEMFLFYGLLVEQCLHRARPFLLLALPCQRDGWGCTRSWEETDRTGDPS